MRRSETTVESDDALLVRQVQAGDVRAFGEFVERYQDRVHNTCRRICRNPEDAEDLTQEAFLKAFAAIGKFECKSSVYTWLFRIAVNLSLSHRKKARLRLVTSLDNGGGPSGGAGPSAAERVVDDHNPGPAARAEARESQDLVSEALESVDDHHRAIVVLRDIEGCDYQQIGEILNVPPGTVKSRLYRGRLALREALERLQSDASRRSSIGLKR